MKRRLRSARIFNAGQGTEKMVAEVLDMEEFDAGTMCERLSYISAYGDMLTFHFHDGHTERRKYIPGKRGYRRKEGKPCREEG